MRKKIKTANIKQNNNEEHLSVVSTHYYRSLLQHLKKKYLSEYFFRVVLFVSLFVIFLHDMSRAHLTDNLVTYGNSLPARDEFLHDDEARRASNMSTLTQTFRVR